jgi:hypothetical protein
MFSQFHSSPASVGSTPPERKNGRSGRVLTPNTKGAAREILNCAQWSTRGIPRNRATWLILRFPVASASAFRPCARGCHSGFEAGASRVSLDGLSSCAGWRRAYCGCAFRWYTLASYAFRFECVHGRLQNFDLVLKCLHPILEPLLKFQHLSPKTVGQMNACPPTGRFFTLFSSALSWRSSALASDPEVRLWRALSCAEIEAPEKSTEGKTQ